MPRPPLVLCCLVVALGGCASQAPGGGSGPTDDPILGDYALTWGPLQVAPGTESTQCIWRRLGNDAEIKVHGLHNTLSTSSHHLIVYKDDMDTTEQTTPVPCQPFTGALNATGRIFPMMITQKRDDVLTLPPHVAYTLAPHQMIKIEMHYLNAGEAAASATATVDFLAADPTAIRDEANILFIGSPDITIGPNQSATVHQFFNPNRAGLHLDDARFFAITGHTHRLGTSVTVDVGLDPVLAIDPKLVSVYAPQPFSWSEPETTTHSPEFSVPTSGGFDFTCKYYNSTGATVRFGESANNEMCFFWAYYYPSTGAHVCAHTNYRNLNLDLCCPEAGAQLCSLLEGSL
mgnify:CR=1 FL=1